MKTRPQAGYTLIELMIAVAIISIASLVIVTTLSARQRDVSELRERDAATTVAATVLEELRAARLDDREQVASKWRATPLESPPDATIEIEFMTLRPNLVQAAVTVRWVSPKQARRAVRLVTTRGKYQ